MRDEKAKCDAPVLRPERRHAAVVEEETTSAQSGAKTKIVIIQQGPWKSFVIS